MADPLNFSPGEEEREEISLSVIFQYLSRIDQNVQIILGRLKKMAMTLADVDAQLVTADTTLAEIKTANEALIAKLGAQPLTADTSAQVVHLQNVNAALEAILSADKAALNPTSTTPATTDTPAPTETPAPTV